MRKIMLSAFVFFLVVDASAKDTDNWPATKEGLRQCLDLADTQGGYYLPAGWLTKRALASKLGRDEEIRGFPGGCVKEDLPDRLNGIGWIRVAANEPYVYQKNALITEPSRDARCNNKAHEVVLFSPPKGEKGDRGEMGPPGPQGPRGLPGLDFRPTRRPLCGESWRTGRRWGCVAVGVLVGSGIAAAAMPDKKTKSCNYCSY